LLHPETKSRTIVEYCATAAGVASGNMDDGATAVRAQLVAAGERPRTLLPPRENRGWLFGPTFCRAFSGLDRRKRRPVS
jgi:hypothetical protein